MDDVEFLMDCVKDGKLSKEQAQTILTKRAEIFVHNESSGASGQQRKAAANPFYTVGCKRPSNSSFGKM